MLFGEDKEPKSILIQWVAGVAAQSAFYFRSRIARY